MPPPDGQASLRPSGRVDRVRIRRRNTAQKIWHVVHRLHRFRESIHFRYGISITPMSIRRNPPRVFRRFLDHYRVNSQRVGSMTAAPEPPGKALARLARSVVGHRGEHQVEREQRADEEKANDAEAGILESSWTSFSKRAREGMVDPRPLRHHVLVLCPPYHGADYHGAELARLQHGTELPRTDGGRPGLDR
jgi:hypothetical protein